MEQQQQSEWAFTLLPGDQPEEAKRLQHSIAKGIICPKITLSTPLLTGIVMLCWCLLLGLFTF